MKNKLNSWSTFLAGSFPNSTAESPFRDYAYPEKDNKDNPQTERHLLEYDQENGGVSFPSTHRSTPCEGSLGEIKAGKSSWILGIFSSLLLMVVVAGCNSSASQKDADGFVPMFDGKTLNNWEGDMEYWSVRDGVLTGEETPETAPLMKANTFLIWKGGQPSDFELKAEYRISPEGNSGIQYRSEKVEGVPFGLRGYQLDIDGANHYTGQNYEERARSIMAFRGQKVTLPPVSEPLKELVKKNVWTASEVTGSLGSADSLKSLIHDGWNTCHIIAKGNHLQHFINGVLMCDVTDDDTANRKASGLIGLQLHAHHVMKVEFRNIRIKE